jgi:glycosyltransferase involved in cell wall biosynthesis
MKHTLQVLFFTHWEDHPYISQLTISLSENDATVEYSRSLKYLIQLGFTNKKYDVIHLHWLHPFFISSNLFNSIFGAVKLVFGLFLAKLRGTRLVWTVHNLENHENINIYLDRVCSQVIFFLSDAVIAHCNQAKFLIQSRFFFSNDCPKISIIPHGDFSNYYPNKISFEESKTKLGLKEASLTYLFLGVIKPYKGLEEVVNAFQRICLDRKDSSVRLLIVGRVPKEEPLDAKLIKTIESNRKILFKPEFIDDNDIQLYMNASDVVVFPYREILTSGSIIMAMSFAKPCIAPKIGCISETLPASPMLYEKGAVDGLYQAMLYALDNKSSLEGIGEQNKKMSDSFNWDKIAQLTYSRT